MKEQIQALWTLRRLMANLRLSQSQLEEIQRNKLLALVRHAFDNVPFFRERLTKAAIHPKDLRSIRDFYRVPLLTRQELQTMQPGDIMARGATPETCRLKLTSGSSGTPLKIYQSPGEYLLDSLVYLRTFLKTGYKLWQRQAIVCDTRYQPQRRHWFQPMGLFKKMFIPAQGDTHSQIQLLKQFRPAYIHGYPTSLALIAGEVQAKGITGIHPRHIASGGEMLTLEDRHLINRVFSVTMTDTYAAHEAGVMAWQCPMAEGYHINTDQVFLEILNRGKPAAPGEPGRVVVSKLHAYAMPIIRYELGDLAAISPEPCPCGLPLPLLTRVQGRSDDTLISCSGSPVSPRVLVSAMKAVEGEVRQFKIVQKGEKKVCIQLVRGSGYSPATPQTIHRLLTELLGAEMELHIETVEAIAKDPSGKIRAIFSDFHPYENG